MLTRVFSRATPARRGGPLSALPLLLLLQLPSPVHGTALDSESPQSCAAPELPPEPTRVRYGEVGDAGAEPEVSFEATREGALRAVDRATGRLLWLYQPELSEAPTSQGRIGDVTVLRFDANSDGRIDPLAGDRVWLYLGMRRRGTSYVALDVTLPDRFRIIWKVGGHDLPGGAETWSRPAIGRVRILNPALNPEGLVLFVGGGYDAKYDAPGYPAAPAGNRIFMLDAATGKVLWSAGAPAEGARDGPDLALPRMTHAVAARIVPLDLDGDELIDRLYTADLGGQLWRFDLHNGSARGEFARGGVLASLGAAEDRDPAADARRFFFEPDVALMTDSRGAPYANLAIGSGDLAHAGSRDVRDRFYAVRDLQPFRPRIQAEFDSAPPIHEQDLTDITTRSNLVPGDISPYGWRLDLSVLGKWRGQKVLGRALTVRNTVLFTTQEPVDPRSPEAGCTGSGRNRAYAIALSSGRAALGIDLEGKLEDAEANRSVELEQTGLPGALGIDLESDAASAGPLGDDSLAAPIDSLGRRARCRAGAEILKRCISPGGLVRTFWYRKAVK